MLAGTACPASIGPADKPQNTRTTQVIAELSLPEIKAASLRSAATALPAPRSGLRPRAHGRASSVLPPD